MKRGKPIKRTPFKAKTAKPARQAKQTDYCPRPREVVKVRSRDAGAAAPPAPKFAYVRDLRLRVMCRSMVCQLCNSPGPGVTWAHSNQSEHGKGMGVKASDIFVAALCHACHVELDQGKAWNQKQRVAFWTAAHERTVRLALKNGTWPSDIELPAWARAEPADEQHQACLAALRTSSAWMSAREVAAIVGLSWQIVSFALRRLAEEMQVEEDVVDQAGRSRSVEHQRVYRARPGAGWVRRVETTLPGWLAPQAVIPTGVSRMVMGAAGVRRWQDGEAQSNGGPDGPEKGAASTPTPSSSPSPIRFSAKSDDDEDGAGWSLPWATA